MKITVTDKGAYVEGINDRIFTDASFIRTKTPNVLGDHFSLDMDTEDENLFSRSLITGFTLDFNRKTLVIETDSSIEVNIGLDEVFVITMFDRTRHIRRRWAVILPDDDSIK